VWSLSTTSLSAPTAGPTGFLGILPPRRPGMQRQRKPKVPFRSLDTEPAPELLSFRYERPKQQPPPPRQQRRPADNRRVVRRATFLSKAGLRFVLDTNDAHVTASEDDWAKHLLLVLVPTVDDTVLCPLCLEPPVAPRIASCCSNCFCLGCVVRLRQYQLEYQRSCPVCHAEQSVMVPAKVVRQTGAQVGDVVDFDLVVRIKGNNQFAMPLHPHWRLHVQQASSLLLPWSEPLSRFCKFVYADQPAILGEEEVRRGF
jgi:hypothetical protein